MPRRDTWDDCTRAAGRQAGREAATLARNYLLENGRFQRGYFPAMPRGRVEPYRGRAGVAVPRLAGPMDRHISLLITTKGK